MAPATPWGALVREADVLTHDVMVISLGRRAVVTGEASRTCNQDTGC